MPYVEVDERVKKPARRQVKRNALSLTHVRVIVSVQNYKKKQATLLQLCEICKLTMQKGV